MLAHIGTLRRAKMKPERIIAGIKLTITDICEETNCARVAPEITKPIPKLMIKYTAEAKTINKKLPRIGISYQKTAANKHIVQPTMERQK